MKPEDVDIELLRSLLDEAIKTVLSHLPAAQEMSMQVIETVFVPKAVARQLALAMALETAVITMDQLHQITHALVTLFSSKSRLIRQLKRNQQEATTQDEWMDLAERIDHVQGNDVWRSNPDCLLYERDRISARIDEFIHLMRRRDIFDLMFTLRGGMGRNKFGLLHEGLFSKALAGSKVLVETYHNVVCAALDFCCDAPVHPNEDPIPTEARLAFFNEARHSYGRTALLLSGGAALGFYHVGVVKTLMENGLLPRVLGGSSAGSILCAIIGTRTNDECFNDLFEAKGTTAPGHSGELRLNFFRPLGEENQKAENRSDLGEVYQNTAGAFHDSKRTFQIFVPIGLRRATSVLYDIMTGKRRSHEVFKHDTDHFRQCVRASVGNFTFQEAFDRTGRILNITVTPKNASDPPRLLNYLTAPHVLVWSAAVASSSLPGVFEANKLMVKDADGTERYESAAAQDFSDGSMEADLPMQQLSEMFNINHFIISQANPHAVLFAGYNANKSVWNDPISGFAHGILLFLKNQVRAWLTHVVELVGGRRIAPLFQTARGMGSTFFTQEYEGRPCDISLTPWLHHRSLFSALLHCIYNPNEDEFRDWIMAAQRETWRHIPAIKSHCAEEMTLDRCVQRLRKRVLTESWEKQRTSNPNLKMGDRVPSFFQSPSLVNMGGLGITDNMTLQAGDMESSSKQLQEEKHAVPVSSLEINQGWSGMGLRGNHSHGSLNRSASQHSGIFLDAESDDDERRSGDQVAGELTTTSPITRKRSGSLGKKWSGTSLEKLDEQRHEQCPDYIKTTSMASFYYRKSNSHDHLLSLRSKSEDDMKNNQAPTPRTYIRKMSKSAVDLGRHSEYLETVKD